MKRIDSFLDSLVLTNIQFIYFGSKAEKYAAHLTTPAMRYSFNYKDYYLVKGHGESGYFYTYEESSLKYMVRIEDNTIAYEPIRGYNLGGGELIVNHGDHLTVGLRKVSDNIFLDTHYTSYTPMDVNPANYETDRVFCFIKLEGTINKNTSCYNVFKKRAILQDNSLGKSFEFKDDLVPLISQYSKIMLGTCVGGGKKQKIYSSKKGRYIHRKGRRFYIQYGGALQLEYKGISMGKEVADYITKTVIEPIGTQNDMFSGATIVYDALCETGPMANESLILLLYFGNNIRQLFRIETLSLLMATYADKLPSVSVTEDEKRALEKCSLIANQIQISIPDLILI